MFIFFAIGGNDMPSKNFRLLCRYMETQLGVQRQNFGSAYYVTAYGITRVSPVFFGMSNYAFGDQSLYEFLFLGKFHPDNLHTFTQLTIGTPDRRLVKRRSENWSFLFGKKQVFYYVLIKQGTVEQAIDKIAHAYPNYFSFAYGLAEAYTIGAPFFADNLYLFQLVLTANSSFDGVLSTVNLLSQLEYIQSCIAFVAE